MIVIKYGHCNCLSHVRSEMFTVDQRNLALGPQTGICLDRRVVRYVLGRRPCLRGQDATGNQHKSSCGRFALGCGRRGRYSWGGRGRRHGTREFQDRVAGHREHPDHSQEPQILVLLVLVTFCKIIVSWSGVRMILIEHGHEYDWGLTKLQNHSEGMRTYLAKEITFVHISPFTIYTF